MIYNIISCPHNGQVCFSFKSLSSQPIKAKSSPQSGHGNIFWESSLCSRCSFFEEISLKIDNLKKETDILLSEIESYESDKNNKEDKKTCNFLKRKLQNIIDIVKDILKKINQYKSI